MSELRAFTMPKWGIEMAEGIVSEWQVAQGDAFQKGQILVGIETDKIVNEVEAEYDAVCLRRIAQEGDTLAVGELLAVFGAAATSDDQIDQFIAAFVPAGGAPTDDQTATDPEPVAESVAAPVTPAPPPAAPDIPDHIRISPRAAQAVGELMIDVTTIKGSGRNGRIQLQDVHTAARSVPVSPSAAVDNQVDLSALRNVAATDVAKRVAQRDGLDITGIEGSGRYNRVRVGDLPASVAAVSAPGSAVPFSNMRKQIARRLTASYQNIPHYNVQIDVFVDALLAARNAFNAAAQRKTSVNDWLVRAVALTLVEHPDININVGDEEIVPFSDANVAIAVAIEGGLMTPVLHRAQTLALDKISAGVADLAQRAREGKLGSDDLRDGSFTISNLGMFDVSQFTALINPPQGAILAVGAARPVPTERDGRIAFGRQMTLTLGCDHRAIDGAMAGRFLSDLRGRLEHPQTLLG